MACVGWESVRFLFMFPNSYSTTDTALGIAHWKDKSTAEWGSKQPVLVKEITWPSSLTHQLVTSIKKCSSWYGWPMCALCFLSHISLEKTHAHQLITVYTGPPSHELKEPLLPKLSLMEPRVPREIFLWLLRSSLNSIPPLFWVFLQWTPWLSLMPRIAAMAPLPNPHPPKKSLQLLQQVPVLSCLRPHLPLKKTRSQDAHVQCRQNANLVATPANWVCHCCCCFQCQS